MKTRLFEVRRERCLSRVPPIQAWVKLFIGAGPELHLPHTQLAGGSLLTAASSSCFVGKLARTSQTHLQAAASYPRHLLSHHVTSPVGEPVPPYQDGLSAAEGKPARQWPTHQQAAACIPDAELAPAPALPSLSDSAPQGVAEDFNKQCSSIACNFIKKHN